MRTYTRGRSVSSCFWQSNSLVRTPAVILVLGIVCNKYVATQHAVGRVGVLCNVTHKCVREWCWASSYSWRTYVQCIITYQSVKWARSCKWQNYTYQRGSWASSCTWQRNTWAHIRLPRRLLPSPAGWIRSSHQRPSTPGETVAQINGCKWICNSRCSCLTVF